MGATQSLAAGSGSGSGPGPGSSSSKPNPLGPGTNQAAVAALIRQRMSEGLAPPDVYRPNYVTLFEDKRFASTSASQRAAPPTSASNAAAPPPACPMHDPSSSSGPSPPFASSSSSSKQPASPASSSTSGSSSLLSKINPLNMMPELSQAPVSQDQQVQLSTERTISSIPRAPTSAAPGASPYDAPSACPVPHETRQAMAAGSGASGAKESSPSPSSAQGEGNWEYPSSQQFYNALVRKGWETPEEHVDMMVLVHNFLNERAWKEVLAWEESMGVDSSKISLARFQGRPGTLSPKARLFSWLGVIAPSRFSSDPPFDRHDWVVRRPLPADASPDSPPKDVRYVIDYYQEPDDPTTEEPVFFLDVRPALDSFETVQARIKVGLEELRRDGFSAFSRSQEDKKEQQQQQPSAASA